ncbi:hypothetical protein J4E86_008605 [Alternaria arbusti]|uniref:uncharacterized protein n=1 Tax=Alternaria arbusti TaxID=232088 RepID=UPI00221F712A|nr:uncharacterized protein J4E86_008605 [Alternaria arbusti]KAI4946982.1 hypothetical protein J4E86_008605 [Alternaria arbusti]
MAEDEIVYHYFLELWVDMWFYTFSVGLSKFVILGFYWRTFGLSVIRQPIRILFVCSACWIIVRPIQKFWYKDIPGKCTLPPMMSLFAAAIPHFILEVAILLCPLYEISRLHISTARKVAVAAMFAAGLLNPHPDLTYDGIDDQIWAVCDVNLASFASQSSMLKLFLEPGR